MNWDKDDPLARCQGETKRSSAALADYALMGPGRSLARLLERYRNERKTLSVKPPSVRLATLANWSRHYAWQDRVAAWEDIKRAEAEAEWGRRRNELCEIEWSKAKALLERAEDMLKHPLTEHVVDHEGQTVVVKPVRWSASDTARYLETASKLMRLAAGAETERGAVGFDESTRRLLAQVGLLAANCITDPVQRERFEHELGQIAGETESNA